MNIIYEEYNGLEINISESEKVRVIASILKNECFSGLELNNEQSSKIIYGIENMLLEYCFESLEDMEYCFKDNIKEYFDNRAYMIYKNKD